MKKIDWKVAIITGAGRGHGRAAAVSLASAGWTVVINDTGDNSMMEKTLTLVTQAGGDGRIVQADITSAGDRKRLVDETLDTYGRLDLLVNSTDITPRQRLDILDIEEQSLREVMDANLIGPFFLTQLAARVMVDLISKKVVQNPRIINIGSISAYASSVTRAEYCLSKAGLGMSTLLFADRLANEGVTVYEVRTGIINTPMVPAHKENFDRLIADGLTPIRRWGEPEEVGKAVLAIAEGSLPFSTGQVIDVDGGFTSRAFNINILLDQFGNKARSGFPAGLL